MSEMMIEHPIKIIEKFLELGKGDKGRLLYLRKALASGKTIYDSDKKYLNKLQQEINQNHKIINDFPETCETKIGVNSNKKTLSKFELSQLGRNLTRAGHEDHIDNFENEIQTIQNSLDILKKKESGIKDNLELLLASRKNTSKNSLKKSNSTVSFSNLSKNSSSDLFDLIKNPTTLENSKFFGIKKYDLMAYVSAGLFSAWFAGYVNLINLGSVDNLFFGLSAGAAVSAGLFYMRTKKLKQHCNP